MTKSISPAFTQTDETLINGSFHDGFPKKQEYLEHQSLYHFQHPPDLIQSFDSSPGATSIPDSLSPGYDSSVNYDSFSADSATDYSNPETPVTYGMANDHGKSPLSEWCPGGINSQFEPFIISPNSSLSINFNYSNLPSNRLVIDTGMIDELSQTDYLFPQCIEPSSADDLPTEAIQDLKLSTSRQVSQKSKAKCSDRPGKARRKDSKNISRSEPYSKSETALTKSESFKCHYCSRRFQRGEHRKRHHLSVHASDRPFLCPVSQVLGDVFCSRTQKVTDSEGNTSYPCKDFQGRLDNCNQHMQTHVFRQKARNPTISMEALFRCIELCDWPDKTKEKSRNSLEHALAKRHEWNHDSKKFVGDPCLEFGKPVAIDHKYFPEGNPEDGDYVYGTDPTTGVRHPMGRVWSQEGFLWTGSYPICGCENVTPIVTSDVTTLIESIEPRHRQDAKQWLCTQEGKRRL